MIMLLSPKKVNVKIPATETTSRAAAVLNAALLRTSPHTASLAI